MCGIIYAKNLVDNYPVNNLVKILYQNQKDRGQQGFGFVGLLASRIDIYRATNEKGITTYLNQYQYDELIFHHRLPTSTENTLKSTHPFIIEIENKKYYFMHNGIIQNVDTLRENHSQKGIIYSSQDGPDFNDSESLAWDFCLWLNNKQEKVRAQGSVAFICLETDKEINRAQKLYFYRNDEAFLKIYKDKTLLLLSSEGNYPLLKKNQLWFWDYQKRRISTFRALKIQVPDLFNYKYDYNFWDDELYEEDSQINLLEIKDDIKSLEQERDYFLTIGRYGKAERIDEEIEDLKKQYKELKKSFDKWGKV